MLNTRHSFPVIFVQLIYLINNQFQNSSINFVQIVIFKNYLEDKSLHHSMQKCVFTNFIQNKMNKTNSSKRSYSSKKPQGMRVIMKRRNNYRQTYELSPNQSPFKHTDGEKQSNIVNDGSETVSQIKYFIKNRMRTQYSDHFHGNQSISRQQVAPKERQQLLLRSSSSNKNLNQNPQKSTSRSFYQPSAAKLSVNNQITSNQAEQKDKQIKIQFKTLEEIEDRFELLINSRLEDCSGFKKGVDWTVQSQLSKLLESLKKIKQEQNPENINQDLQYRNKKIKLLQKMIAETFTESQMMKKFYLSKVSKQGHRKYKTMEASLTNFKQFKPINENQNTSLIQSSVNQQSFKKPDRSAYSIYKHKNCFFNADRDKQPLPRSTYGRQYLVYGVSPVVPHIPIDNDYMKGYSSSKLLNSSYQSNFGPKIAEKINIKELDACRNKFKNLPVIFGRRQKQDLIQKISTYQREKKALNPGACKYQKSSYIPMCMLSQSRRQFNNREEISPSVIKHENLQKLKYFYKKKMHV